jgi:hypothetical protein
LLATDFLADEVFLRPLNERNTTVDVDGGLVQVPPGREKEFSPAIPRFGKPEGVYVPNRSSAAAYQASLVKLPVFSYSWQSLDRYGHISHAFYVHSRSLHRGAVIACFIVKSTSGEAGVDGDSGKLWMTAHGGRTLAVGLHFGILRRLGSRFAAATDFGALARFMNVTLV